MIHTRSLAPAPFMFLGGEVEMNKNEYLNCFMEHGVNGVWKSEFAASLLKAMLCCVVMFLLYTSPHVERWKL